MSPVSRRRGGGRKPSTAQSASAVRARATEVRRLMAEPPLDALTSRIAKLGTDDAFAAEALMSYVLDVVVGRGPDADEQLARFSRAAVSDPRAGTTPLGVRAMVAVSLLGHRDVRDEARALVAAADPEHVPAWAAGAGAVEVVQTGLLSARDGSESVLHLLLDHADPVAGPRHLVSIAVEHGENRVHLLDVRVRAPQDVLDPMAEAYADPAGPRWTWGDRDSVLAVAEPALRTTSLRTSRQWPVLGIEGAETLTWWLGVQRLEQVTGSVLA